MAWAWVLYAASLGCQASYVSLGVSKGIVGPLLLALVVPQIFASFKDTCGLHFLCERQPMACSTALNLTLIILALMLWYGAPFVPGERAMQLAIQSIALILVLIDAFLLLPVPTALLVAILTSAPLLLQIIPSFFYYSPLPTRTARHHLHAP